MITCKTKQWGNSVGIIIPKKVVKQLGIKPNDEIVIDVDKKGNVLQEMFGSVKFKRSVESIMKDAKKELNSKF